MPNIDSNIERINNFKSLSFGWNYIKSLRSSRYRLTTTIGEHIDNSLDAGAKVCKVDFIGKSNNYNTIVISDNGTGMDHNTLCDSFTLGLARKSRPKNANGKFGLGGTTSALSISARKVVVTRHASGMYAQKYDLRDVKEKDCWGTTTIPVTKEYVEMFNKYVGENSTGTLVLLRDLDRLNSKVTGNSKTSVIKYISKTYCSFMETGSKAFYVCDTKVEPKDPLMWWDPDVEKLIDNIPIPGTKTARLKAVSVYNIHSTKSGRMNNSGGRLYRENRLITDGIFKNEAWPSLYDKAQNKRDLRWAIFFGAEDDEVFRIANSKDDAQPAANLESWVSNKLMPWVRKLADKRDKRDSVLSEEEKAKVKEQEEDLVNETAVDAGKTSELIEEIIPDEKEEGIKGADIPLQPVFSLKKKPYKIFHKDLHYTGPLAFTEKASKEEDHEYSLIVNSAHPFTIKYYNNGTDTTRQAITTLLHSVLMAETMIGHESQPIRMYMERFNSIAKQLTIKKDNI